MLFQSHVDRDTITTKIILRNIMYRRDRRRRRRPSEKLDKDSDKDTRAPGRTLDFFVRPIFDSAASR